MPPFNPGFNSRTRKGATEQDQEFMLTYEVSIHAPVRVRQLKNKLSYTTNVSIHAPVRVRLIKFSITSNRISFNSRTREGATNGSAKDHSHPGFNSRTREGATKPVKNLL